MATEGGGWHTLLAIRAVTAVVTVVSAVFFEDNRVAKGSSYSISTLGLSHSFYSGVSRLSETFMIHLFTFGRSF